jgi:hypothetical protein
MSDPHEKMRDVPSSYTLSSIPIQMYGAIDALKRYYSGDRSESTIADLARRYSAISWAMDDVQAAVISLLTEIRGIIGEDNIK